MTEKERELRQKMAKVTEEIRALMADKKLDEAESKTAELRELKRQMEIEQTLADVPATVPPAARAAEITDEEKRDLMFSGLVKEIKRQMPTDAEAEVLKEARAGMKAGVDADGGLIVPQDISTQESVKSAGPACHDYAHNHYDGVTRHGKMGRNDAT